MKTRLLLIFLLSTFIGTYAQNSVTRIQGRPAVVVGNDIYCGLTGSTCFILYTYTDTSTQDAVIVETFKEKSIDRYESNSNYTLDNNDSNTTNASTMARFEYLTPIKNEKNR
ncbi:hypothetical protein [Myroides sp. WP-1]|uniref:hypothetical protein n=1 Tax=Myroides sp. WP-1 TaxID=2759944 RepID=UPI0015F89FEE|nr:hypothetical protein [Myroides sp. WP-1]MBB1140020.1 hypothetical protein [Myroides sp. WP-1]